jgi:ABC-type amino acid transport system permease subunit
VSRRYHRGNASVTIEIISDSPIIATVAAFMNGILTMAGTELVMIDGHKTNYRKNENSYTTLVADKAMITVKGSGGVADEDLRAYVKAIHFAQIEKLVK